MSLLSIIQGKNRASGLPVTGDPISAVINADGGSMDITFLGLATGGTYAQGLGANNNPLMGTPKVTVTMVDMAFDNTGTATTAARLSYSKNFAEKSPLDTSAQESNDGTYTTVRVWLSEPVYAKAKAGAGNSGTDPFVSILSGFYTSGGTPNNAKVIAVTNNSTLPYPKAVGRWAWGSYDRWTGDTLIEVTGYSPWANDGKPFACVKLDAVDQHSNAMSTATVTAMTLSARGGDSAAVGVYAATVPVASMTQGDVITCRARWYPWFGDAASVLDSDTSADGVAGPAETLTPLYGLLDKTGAAVKYASVDGVGGAPAVQSTAALARTTPYTTLALALTALKAANTTLDNCVVLMQNGTYTGPGTFTGGNTKSVCVVQADLANGATKAGVIFSTATNQGCNAWLKFQDVTLSGSGSGLLRGNTSTGLLWLDSCSLGATATSAWYQWNLAYATRNVYTASNTTGFMPFSTNRCPFALVRGNDISAIANGLNCTAYCMVGNRGAVPRSQDFGNVAGNAISNNVVIGWNETLSLTSRRWLDNGWNGTDASGIMIFGNVAERITDNTTPFFQIVADNNATSNVNNVCLAYNTVVGQRCNINYLEFGNVVGTRLNWFEHCCAFSDWNCKDGAFSNANRVVTDAVLNGTTTVTSATAAFSAGDTGQNLSCEGIPGGIQVMTYVNSTTVTIANAATVSATGVTAYLRNYGKSALRTTNGPFINGVGCYGSVYEQANFPRKTPGSNNQVVGLGLMGYTLDKSTHGTNTGGGDYHPTVGSPLLGKDTRCGLPFDLNGVTRVVGDSAGAYHAV